MHAYKKIIIIFILILTIPNIVQATDEIIESQLEALNLSSFIQEGEKYTKESFNNLDIGQVLN